MTGFTEDLNSYNSFVNEQELANNFETNVRLKWLVQYAYKSFNSFKSLAKPWLKCYTSYDLMKNFIKRDVLIKLYDFITSKVINESKGFGYYILSKDKVVLSFWSQSEDLDISWATLGKIYYTGYCTREEHEFKVNTRQFIPESSNE